MHSGGMQFRSTPPPEITIDVTPNCPGRAMRYFDTGKNVQVGDPSGPRASRSRCRAEAGVTAAALVPVGMSSSRGPRSGGEAATEADPVNVW